MKKQNIDAHEVYKHYGMEKDLEAVKNKEIEGVDFLVGREEELETYCVALSTERRSQNE